MHLSLRQLFMVGFLTMHVISCTSAQAGEPCGEVLEKPLTLDEAGAKKFSLRKFQRKLKRSRKGVQDWLAAAGDNVRATIEETEMRMDESYPACMYEASCASKTTTALYWQVPGTNCWNVEPIAWVSCQKEAVLHWCRASGEDDVNVGYSCRERYTNMQVWVFCSGKAGIQVMTIGVPTACIAVKNRC